MKKGKNFAKASALNKQMKPYFILIILEFACFLHGTVFKNDVSGNGRTVSLLDE